MWPSHTKSGGLFTGIAACVDERWKRLSVYDHCYTPQPETSDMKLRIELEREDDGRWMAEVVDLPGVLVYGSGSDEAIRGARALALRVLADRIEHGEVDSEANHVEFLLPEPSTAA